MSVYVLAVDGVVQKYPYTITDMRVDNPNVSFPNEIGDDTAAGFNTFPVEEVEQPPYNRDTETLVWVNPTYSNGKWRQNWRVDTLPQSEIDKRLNTWRQSASCTPFQGRVALSDAGILSQVEAAISSADEKTKVAWEYALEWKRMSPMIVALATALNMTDEEVDNLFKSAQTIAA